MPCNQYCKSTVSAYSYSQTVQPNGTLTFSNNEILTGTSISHTPGSSTFNLNKPGLYQVDFSGTTTASAAGTVSLQLNRNGVAVPDGLATRIAVEDGSSESFSASPIIEVKEVCPCAGTGQSSIPLTFTNTGIEAIYIVVKVRIIKIA